MGITTAFIGSFAIMPPLTPEKAKEINTYYEQRFKCSEIQCCKDDDEECTEISPINHFISHYCNWVITKDGTKIKWNGGEKFYYYQEWMQAIYYKFLQPHGHQLYGCIHYFEPAKVHGTMVANMGINMTFFTERKHAMTKRYQELKKAAWAKLYEDVE